MIMNFCALFYCLKSRARFEDKRKREFVGYDTKSHHFVVQINGFAEGSVPSIFSDQQIPNSGAFGLQGNFIEHSARVFDLVTLDVK
uniref:Pentatricopeptide repeat-containing protein At3g16610 n=1 Tax=Rhizophora mucronata TaxID=61149 RepID=A0A2P2IRY7_RHIMU